MKIRKATKDDKVKVLQILDDFRSNVHKIITPENAKTFTDAQDKGSNLFDSIINDPGAAIFIAEEDDSELAGIITVYELPVLRKAEYRAEIEEMYVKEKYQGKGVAQMLMDSAKKWCKENGINVVCLESGKELSRAHKFYAKEGFEDYGKAFKFRID